MFETRIDCETGRKAVRIMGVESFQLANYRIQKSDRILF
ncbi:hypothetical protein NMD1_03015 [Novosphingobium sp. MD-1]|nr:hypothetical protein NMD1_03015 [Novosphingobium sp. MD-1]